MTLLPLTGPVALRQAIEHEQAKHQPTAWEIIEARAAAAEEQAIKDGADHWAFMRGWWHGQSRTLHERLRRFEAAGKFVLEVTGGSKDWHGDTREMLRRLEGLLDA